MAGSRRSVSLLGMSARVAVPALLGLALLLVAGTTTLVRLVDREPAAPLTVQVLRLPMDGSCYVVSATGFDLGDPPPAPPPPGSPVDALDAWSTAARATPVGSGRTRLTVVAGSQPVTLTGVEVSGTARTALLQRDWSLRPGCDPDAEVVPSGTSGTSGVPVVLLRGELDGVGDGRRVTLSPGAGNTSLPLTLRPGQRAHLLLDLSVREVSVHWAATLRWSVDGRAGRTLVDAPQDAVGLQSGAQVQVHYGWDAGARRWVRLPGS